MVIGMHEKFLANEVECLKDEEVEELEIIANLLLHPSMIA